MVGLALKKEKSYVTSTDEFSDDYYRAFTPDDGFSTPYDILEIKQCYFVRIDLLDLQDDSLKIKYKNGLLYVHGRYENSIEKNTKHDKSKLKFSRIYAIDNVDSKSIIHNYDDGILTIVLQKEDRTK